MKKYFLIIFVIFLVGCSDEDGKDKSEIDINEIDLTGSKWVVSAEKEEMGKESCFPVNKGIEFKDDHTAYQMTDGDKLKYRIRETDDGYMMDFRRPTHNGFWYSYNIEAISDNEISLVGVGDVLDVGSCKLERK